jgi:hypothetical protein
MYSRIDVTRSISKKKTVVYYSGHRISFPHNLEFITSDLYCVSQYASYGVPYYYLVPLPLCHGWVLGKPQTCSAPPSKWARLWSALEGNTDLTVSSLSNPRLTWYQSQSHVRERAYYGRSSTHYSGPSNVDRCRFIVPWLRPGKQQPERFTENDISTVHENSPTIFDPRTWGQRMSLSAEPGEPTV